MSVSFQQRFQGKIAVVGRDGNTRTLGDESTIHSALPPSQMAQLQAQGKRDSVASVPASASALSGAAAREPQHAPQREGQKEQNRRREQQQQPHQLAQQPAPPHEKEQQRAVPMLPHQVPRLAQPLKALQEPVQRRMAPGKPVAAAAPAPVPVRSGAQQRQRRGAPAVMRRAPPGPLVRRSAAAAGAEPDSVSGGAVERQAAMQRSILTRDQWPEPRREKVDKVDHQIQSVSSFTMSDVLDPKRGERSVAWHTDVLQDSMSQQQPQQESQTFSLAEPMNGPGVRRTSHGSMAAAGLMDAPVRRRITRAPPNKSFASQRRQRTDPSAAATSQVEPRAAVSAASPAVSGSDGVAGRIAGAIGAENRRRAEAQDLLDLRRRPVRSVAPGTRYGNAATASSSSFLASTELDRRQLAEHRVGWHPGDQYDERMARDEVTGDVGGGTGAGAAYYANTNMLPGRDATGHGNPGGGGSDAEGTPDGSATNSPVAVPIESTVAGAVASNRARRRRPRPRPLPSLASRRSTGTTGMQGREEPRILRMPEDMLAYSRRPREVEFQPYTVEEFRQLHAEPIRMGGLGPATNAPEYQRKAELLARRRSYGERLRYINAAVLGGTVSGAAPPQHLARATLPRTRARSAADPMQLERLQRKQEYQASKAARAREYAASVPRPRIRKTTSAPPSSSSALPPIVPNARGDGCMPQSASPTYDSLGYGVTPAALSRLDALEQRNLADRRTVDMIRAEFAMS